jgi:lipid-A-disaccharide synthase-like uncharacterized protein
METLGILGALMVVIAWIPPTIQTIRHKRSTMNLWFELLFFLGSGMLTIYSISQGDEVFSALNCIAFVFAFINLQYIPGKARKLEAEIEEISGRKNKKYFHVKRK